MWKRRYLLVPDIHRCFQTAQSDRSFDCTEVAKAQNSKPRATSLQCCAEIANIRGTGEPNARTVRGQSCKHGHQMSTPKAVLDVRREGRAIHRNGIQQRCRHSNRIAYKISQKQNLARFRYRIIFLNCRQFKNGTKTRFSRSIALQAKGLE